MSEHEHVLFHRFAVQAVTGIAKSLPEKDVTARLLTNDMPYLDLFAKHSKAKKIDIPDGSWSGAKWIRNEFVGTSIVVDHEYYADKLYKFGPSVYLGCLTIATIEYGDVMRTYIPFAITKDAAEATSLVSEYYSKRRFFVGQNVAILDHYGEMIKDFRRLDWESIVLPDKYVERIRSEINTFFVSKEEYDKRGLEWRRGMLLAGPPGNGKTSVCRAVASSVDASVIYCEIDEDPSSMVKSLKSTIGKNAPCVCIIEDADSIGENPKARQILLNMMDGIASCSGVFFIASTNCPEKLDFAFTDRPSRFDSYYVIANPMAEQRLKILSAKVKELSRMPVARVNSIIERMEGFSAAAVQEVATCAMLQSLNSKKKLDINMLEDSLRKMSAHSMASKDGSMKWKGEIGFKK